MGKKKNKKKNNKKYQTPRVNSTVKVEDAIVDTAVSNDADKEIVVEDNKIVAKPVAIKEDKPKTKKVIKNKKEKKDGLGKKTKAVVSELKKVTWPTFGELAKQTGIVLGFCLVFVVILLGLNSLFGWLFSLVSDIL